MPIGLAVLGGLGAASGLASGIMGSNAAGKSSRQIQQSLQQGLGLEQGAISGTTQNIQPWIGAGQNALTQLQRLLGIGAGGAGATNPVLQMLGFGPGGTPGTMNVGAFQGSPGYQFQLGQAEQAAQQAGARSGVGGNTLKALAGYGQGLANQDFYNYLKSLGGAYESLVGDVGGLSTTGAQSALDLGRLGIGAAQGQADILGGIGSAAGAGTIGSANALTGGINNALGNLLTTGMMPTSQGNTLFGALQQLIQGSGNQFTPPGGGSSLFAAPGSFTAPGGGDYLANIRAGVQY